MAMQDETGPDDIDRRAEQAARLSGMSRREGIAAITAMGGAPAFGIPEGIANAAPARAAARRASLAAEAASIPPAGGDLGAIDHIVFLMLENRSYDHYF